MEPITLFAPLDSSNGTRRWPCLVLGCASIVVRFTSKPFFRSRDRANPTAFEFLSLL